MATELLLIRHAQAHANKGNFVAFDNKSSPLTEKGKAQCHDLRIRLADEFGIDPQNYNAPVVASEFIRPQETAAEVGFQEVHISPLLNEPDFSRGTMTGVGIVRKHREERWAPQEARAQARQLIEKILNKDFPYFLAFTHGMFTATVLLELEEAGHDMSGQVFDPQRGYVPLQTGIIKLAL